MKQENKGKQDDHKENPQEPGDHVILEPGQSISVPLAFRKFVEVFITKRRTVLKRLADDGQEKGENE